jgi:hypothetical protein
MSGAQTMKVWVMSETRLSPDRQVQPWSQVGPAGLAMLLVHSLADQSFSRIFVRLGVDNEQSIRIGIH